MSKIENSLPKALLQKMATSVQEAFSKDSNKDPLLGDKLSKLLSSLSSLQRRDGYFIENCINFGVQSSDFHTVISEKDFYISETAERLSDQPFDDLSQAPNLAYTGRGTKITIDMIVIDHRSATVTAYEIKRGNGAVDAGKQRQIIREMACIKMLIRSFAQQQGYKVMMGDVKLISYYGKTGLPADLTLTGQDMDQHFGLPVSKFVDDGTKFLRDQIQRALPTNILLTAAE